MSPLDRVSENLRGFAVVNDAQFMALCPAHADREQSLSIRECGAGGKVLMYCHVGCSLDDVLAALNLMMRNLFPSNTPGTQVPLREFIYIDASGEPVFKVQRRRRRDGGKSWVRLHPDGSDWATCRGCGHPQVLYRLPRLLSEADLPVWFTEGERDADAASRAGVLATTVASGSVGRADLSPLRGRQVIIVADHDIGGWNRAKKAQTALQATGAVVLRIVRPQAPYTDLTDHLGEGRSLGDLADVDLVRDSPPPKVPDSPPALRDPYGKNGEAVSIRLPVPLMEQYVAQGRLRFEDLLVYMFLEDRAGASGTAHLGAASIAKRFGRKDPRPITASLKRLTACGFVEQIQAGTNPKWQVWNPSWKQRAGPQLHTAMNGDNMDSPHFFFPNVP